jgi:hypothetical protein
MLAVFVSLAGDTLAGWLLAGAWSVLLTASMVLNYRRGGGFRFVTYGIEVLVLVSAVFMAQGRLQADADSTAAARLAQLRTTQVYLDAREARDTADRLERIDEARLAGLPPTWVTKAAELATEIDERKAERARASKTLSDLEATANAAAGPVTGTLFAGLGPAATVVEFILALAFAVLTEVSALALTRQDRNQNPSRDRQDAQDKSQDGVLDPSQRSGQIGLASPKPVTVADYLKAALEGRESGPLLGRDQVARRLNIGERKARDLYEELVRTDPRIRVANRRTVAERRIKSHRKR